MTKAHASPNAHAPACHELRTWLSKEERSYAWLARKVGASRVHICHIALGNRKPSLSMAVRIFSITKVRPERWVPMESEVAA